ncbi:hypothetical protein GCM10010347_51890 [Streptomyces cirratus]|uniref:Lantibiotic biosynthesis protein dehydration domain-containing protein n=1 Tax=Streptomyces cirratus TaxID=68187 RepID=A0ABQ3F1P6_9ACTN|nr:type 2 lanthipeptide synthetase LanM [Streptomyces cirratus]GHB75155.1 hypothetical protein GCM10010347_51890 [Streptomyces cirratus]
MKSHNDPASPAEALRTYLPELTSPELIARVEERLREAAEEDDGVIAVEDTALSAALPDTYDPSLDVDGLFHDYFAHLIRPWEKLVRAAAESCAFIAAPDIIVADFLEHQTALLSRLMLRTLLEALHRRRSDGLLVGDTPQDRYTAFRQWTNSDAGHAELLSRYPYLFRLVNRQVEAATRYVLELLGEIELAGDDLVALLPGGGTLRVKRLVLGEGDTHNGGRSVAQILFTDGGRVVYKPHPLGAESGYNSFVAWLNDRLGTDLPTVAVLQTKRGGFVEFVPTQEYAGEQKEYFARIGTLAGILFLLRATDIHFENVVSCAAGPVVIDTETLLSPRIRVPESYDTGAASGIAASTLQESIIGSGLLPLVVRAGSDDHGMDIGAIGYDSGQPAPYKSFGIKNPGRDDMSVSMVTMTTTVSNANLAVQRALQLSVPEQRDTIKNEFRRVLDHAAAHPSDVLAAIEFFLGDVQFRHVNQATVFYAQLLRMATHPDAMASPLVRAAVLNRVFLRTGSPEIADDEVRQMSRGDVPYFSYTARSRALQSADGTVHTDALAESPLETLRARIQGIDEAVIERESRLIDFSFVNKLPTDREKTGFVPTPSRDRAAGRIDRDRFIKEAERIGDRLLATLIPSSDPRHPATWIAPQVTTDSQSQWSPGSLGYDLYGGSPGPALVLSALARETGRRDFAHAARCVLDPVEEQLRSGLLAEHGVSVGGMTGLAGTAYALAVARQLLDEPGDGRLGDLARELARSCGTEVGTDFLSGMAGALAVAMALHDRTTDPSERAVVAEAVRSIAAQEVRALGGVALQDARVTQYTGYAHGAMGIAPVLLRYGAQFGDPEVHRLGLRILDAVLGSQDRTDGDWPRVWGGEERSYGWCHGAPGLLLGALLSREHASDAVPRQTLDQLSSLTLARGFGNNPTYCHGDLASAEIARFGERLVPGLFGDGITDLYPRLFDEVIELYGRRSDTKYAYSNSLMVGESGLAWSVLHHLDPEAHPSLLRFA